MTMIQYVRGAIQTGSEKPSKDLLLVIALAVPRPTIHCYGRDNIQDFRPSQILKNTNAEIVSVTVTAKKNPKSG